MRIAITGAATGIGAATAARLKRDGAEITAFDIAEPKANADQYIPVDLSQPGAAEAAAAQAVGPFDALVNAAGLPPRDGLEVPILAVNTLGLIALTEALLPKLAEGGSIVSIASKAGSRWTQSIPQINALLALPGTQALPAFIAEHGIDPVRAYDLSKEAVIVWTMSQTERFISMGLRANTVSPAAIETRILTDFVTAFGDRASKMMARTGRAGTAEEVAELAAFLARPESGWIKGVDVPVDGGTTALLATDQLGLGT